MKERGNIKFYSYVYAHLLGELKHLASQEKASDRMECAKSFAKKLAFFQCSQQMIDLVKDHLNDLIDETSELERYIIVYEEIMYLIEAYFEKI